MKQDKQPTRRQQGALLKKIASEVLKTKDIRVYTGRGTAYHWWHIATREDVPRKLKDEVEKRAEAEKLLGHYYSDMGPGDTWFSCLSWERRYD